MAYAPPSGLRGLRVRSSSAKAPSDRSQAPRQGLSGPRSQGRSLPSEEPPPKSGAALDRRAPSARARPRPACRRASLSNALERELRAGKSRPPSARAAPRAASAGGGARAGRARANSWPCGEAYMRGLELSPESMRALEAAVWGGGCVVGRRRAAGAGRAVGGAALLDHVHLEVSRLSSWSDARPPSGRPSTSCSSRRRRRRRREAAPRRGERGRR